MSDMKVEYIDHMGDDLRVVNAARVSFDKESVGDERCSCGFADRTCPGYPGYSCAKVTVPTEADQKLISYLAKHGHWTPFAHTAVTLRLRAPLPIRTHCFKHKAGFVENEQSRRYIFSAPELFDGFIFRNKPDGSIKQGSGEIHSHHEEWMDEYLLHCGKGIDLYEEMIVDGVCPEQARFVLPQGVLVEWIWTGSLAAFARFYSQRTDSHAQREVAELAMKAGNIIRPLFPFSWEALTNG